MAFRGLAYSGGGLRGHFLMSVWKSRGQSHCPDLRVGRETTLYTTFMVYNFVPFPYSEELTERVSGETGAQIVPTGSAKKNFPEQRDEKSASPRNRSSFLQVLMTKPRRVELANEGSYSFKPSR
eukprot:jgi/Tetstr1/448683/TSEL_035923.t1